MEQWRGSFPVARAGLLSGISSGGNARYQHHTSLEDLLIVSLEEIGFGLVEHNDEGRTNRERAQDAGRHAPTHCKIS